MTEKSIPEGTIVSFIDPISHLPIRGVVRLELENFVGVRFDRKTKVESYLDFGWVNLSKDRVFIVRG